MIWGRGVELMIWGWCDRSPVTLTAKMQIVVLRNEESNYTNS